MKHDVLRVYDKLVSFRVQYPRRLFANRELKIKNKAQEINSLTSKEKSLVNAFWGDIKIKKDYLSLYNRYNTTFDPRFIPDDIYFAEVDTYFNNAVDSEAIDDKNLYDLYFHDVKQPNTIVRKISDSYLDADYQIISFNKIIEKCSGLEEIIIKKAMNSNSGRGIIFWSQHEGIEVLKNILQSPYDYVIQEVIKQHPDVAALHKNSINTLRIVTLYYNGQVHVLSSVIRMGVDGSRVDNTPYSGLFCGINEDGRLKKYAYNMGGYRFDQHPNGVRFNEIKIPNFEKCIEFVTNLAPRFIRFSKLNSWDLAIGEDGLPMLIEVNLSYGQLDYHQFTNGPIFGDLSEEIIKKVFNK